MNYNIGLVLSGGGVRAIAHIGLLQALEENNIHPEIIAGTSGGAMVGALYAAGYDAEVMLKFFNTGQLIKPLLASAALPPVFSPVEIDENLYSDGGILNNFPIEPLLFNCKNVIGSFVNPLTIIKKNEIKSTMALIQRVYHIGLDAKDLIKFNQCNYVFSPPEIYKIGIFESKSVKKAFDVGYKHAVTEMPNILKSLK